MNTVAVTKPNRKLPSADWIAVGLGLLGMALSRFVGPFVGLVGLAVFGPSILRELGILKDSDEWQRGIMHRAGFHAVLAMALFVFLNRILLMVLGPASEDMYGQAQYFDNEYLRQTLVMIFLSSYLIQYWGPARGVSRILAGFAVIISIDMFLRPVWGHNISWFWIPAFTVVGLMFLAAWSAPRWPRVTGSILLFIASVLIGLLLFSIRDVPNASATVQLVEGTLNLLVFGVCGWVLFKADLGEQE